MAKLLSLLLLVALTGCAGVAREPVAPGPTYTWSNEPAPFVLRLDDRDITLRPWTSCWSGPGDTSGIATNVCSDGAPGKPSELDDVGPLPFIDTWFGMPGWDFTATFVQLGTSCPHRWDVPLEHIGAQTFRLTPGGPAGRYQVDLFGQGPQGDEALSFVWTTTSAGPVNQPAGKLALVTDEDDRLTSYGVELGIRHLGSTSRHASAVVEATAANGRSHSVRLAPEPSTGCHDAGSLFLTDTEGGREFARLGPAPFRYAVVLTLDGQEYVGTAVWPRDEIKDEAPYTRLVWSPALPAYEP